MPDGTELSLVTIACGTVMLGAETGGAVLSRRVADVFVWDVADVVVWDVADVFVWDVADVLVGDEGATTLAKSVSV